MFKCPFIDPPPRGRFKEVRDKNCHSVPAGKYLGENMAIIKTLKIITFSQVNRADKM